MSTRTKRCVEHVGVYWVHYLDLPATSEHPRELQITAIYGNGGSGNPIQVTPNEEKEILRTLMDRSGM